MRTKPGSPLTKPHRSMRRTALTQAALAASATAVLSLTACGNAPAQDAASNPSAPVATAPANPSQEAVRVQEAAVAPATFSGPAVDKYGQEAVQDGYATAVEVANNTTFNEGLMTDSPNRSVEDFAVVQEHWTPTMVDSFNTQVGKMLAGDEQANLDVTSVVMNDATSDTVSFPSTGPIIVNHSVSNPRVEVDSSGRLAVTFDEHAEVRANHSGTMERLPIDKAATYYMVRTGQGGWLVDAISAHWRSGSWVPDA